MKRSRLWILGCAVGCFATGMSAGIALPEVFAAIDKTDRPLDRSEHYFRRLQEDYDLSAEQMRELRIIQKRFEQEKDEIFEEMILGDDLPTKQQQLLERIERRRKDRIEAVFTPQQRRQYEQDKRAPGPGEVR